MMTRTAVQIDRRAHMLDEAMDDKGKAPLAFRGGMTFDEFEEVVDPKHEREEAFFEKLGRELTTLKADFSVKAKLTGRDTITVEAPPSRPSGKTPASDIMTLAPPPAGTIVLRGIAPTWKTGASSTN